MVATAGAGWRLAPCLVALFEEADRRKPSRSHAWDGTIGDQAHAARVSDHNPADGWVCAGDVDDDNDSTPVLGVDLLVEHLVATRDPRVHYIIRNRRIWELSTGWKPYDGANPHDHHAHISVWNHSAARDDLRPWWPKPVLLPPKEVDMPYKLFSSSGHIYMATPNGLVYVASPSDLTNLRNDGVVEKGAPTPISAAQVSAWSAR